MKTKEEIYESIRLNMLSCSMVTNYYDFLKPSMKVTLDIIAEKEDHAILKTPMSGIAYSKIKEFIPEHMNKIPLGTLGIIGLLADKPYIAVILAHKATRHLTSTEFPITTLQNLVVDNPTYQDFEKHCFEIWEKQKIRDWDLRDKFETDNNLDLKEYWEVEYF